MLKEKKNIIILVIVVIFIIIMAIWGLSNKADAQFWNENTKVKCLPNSHDNLVIHIHPTLEIYMDGEKQLIPANLGIKAGCMAEIHTHDATGVLHVESFDRNRDFVLSEFFEVWEEPFEREGYSLEITVNGQKNEEYGDFVFRDRDSIVLEYSSLEDL